MFMKNIRLLLIPFATPAFDEAIRLRTDILRIPLGMEFYVEDIRAEFDQYHLGAYEVGGELVGCLSLLPYGKGAIKMRQVAVRENVQGAGIGRQMVEESELIARQLGYTKMVLHARDVAVAFYKKLGYKKIGKMFEEVEIPHFKMEKKLSV